MAGIHWLFLPHTEKFVLPFQKNSAVSVCLENVTLKLFSFCDPDTESWSI